MSPAVRILTALTVATAFVACGDDTTPESSCGDGVLDSGEFCDDGDSENGDGCSSSCSTETGWVCVAGVEPSVCATVCGDGIQLGAEECDDENLSPGDGCSPACLVEGTGVEICDNAGDEDGDGLIDCRDPDCADDVTCENREVCSGALDEDGDTLVDCEDPDCVTDPACALGEDCINGEDDDGDGLVDCDDPECPCEDAFCGNGELDEGEECDDGDGNSASEPDACRFTCQRAFCGDRVVDTGEECDLGMGTNGTEDATCLTDCRQDLFFGCESSETTQVEVRGSDWEDGQVRVEGRLSRTSGNDYSLPVACGIDGVDALVAVVIPQTGWYQAVLNPRGTERPTSLVLADTCDSTIYRACSAGTPLRQVGAIDFEVTITGTYFFAIEQPAETAGEFLLEITRSDSAPAGLGEPCGGSQVCATGLVCDSSSGSSTCVSDVAQISSLGEACDPEGFNPLCVEGTLCEADSSLCVASPGYACDVALDVEEVASGADEPTVVELFPLPVGSPPESRCGSASGWAYVTTTAPGDGVMSFTYSALDADGSVVLSSQVVCGSAGTEVGCTTFSASDVGQLDVQVVRGEVVNLTVMASSAGDLVASFRPYVPVDAACDPFGVLNACTPPQQCLEGMCQDPEPGSCGLPDSLNDLGEGDIFDRGLVASVEAGTGVDGLSGVCGGVGAERVFSWVSSTDGDLRVSYDATTGGPTVYVRTDCQSAVSELACGSSPGEAVPAVVDVAVRAGQQIFIAADATDEEVGGVLVLRLTPRNDVGESCSNGSDCLLDLVCQRTSLELPGVCARPPRTLGQTCRRDGTERCETSLLCANTGDGLRCRNPVALYSEPCGDGVTCSVGLACTDPVGFCFEPREVGSACGAAAAASCNPGLVCGTFETGRVCSLPVVGENEPCSPEVACDAFLTCQAIAGEGTRCVGLPGLGQSCDPTLSPACQDGLVCPSGTPGPTCINRPRREGEACNPLEGVLCAAGLFCIVSGEGETEGVCTRL